MSPLQLGALTPLHIAAALPGEQGVRITELLLHAITDVDARAADQDDVYKLSKVRPVPLGGRAGPGPLRAFVRCPLATCTTGRAHAHTVGEHRGGLRTTVTLAGADGSGSLEDALGGGRCLCAGTCLHRPAPALLVAPPAWASGWSRGPSGQAWVPAFDRSVCTQPDLLPSTLKLNNEAGPPSSYYSGHLSVPDEGGRTALHVACEREDNSRVSGGCVHACVCVCVHAWQCTRVRTCVYV